MRTLKQVIQGRATNDGDGVLIRRIAGSQFNALLDPFLMLDEINSDDASDYIGGFPEHPHRGMETITYMKAGRMRHSDHMGNEGVIGPGDVQWMTAGKGVLHSEMPEQESGLLHGFQLWLNLPAAEKMKPAAYRDIRVNDIPFKALNSGGKVSVIAGEVKVNNEATLKGVLPELTTQPVMMDVSLSQNESLSLSFNSEYPALVYVIEGELAGEITIQKGCMGIFSEGELLTLAAGKEGASLLILSGKPLKEPISQYGPFVMNTRAEIDQAINDFRMGRFI
jgi:redox-sensitive bicupin YhaK (pirin superfamily)